MTEIDADALISEQIEYYRARAPWYDDWWYREGQYATGGELENRWRVDPVASECRDKCHCPPMAMGNMGDQPRSALAPAKTIS